MSRNKARTVAMQALYQIDRDPERMPPLIEMRAEEESLTEKDIKYIGKLTSGVLNNRPMIDDLIQKLSIDWDLSRLGRVDRALLRLAIAEILYVSDVPASVAINEAVRLAKKFGSEPTGKFVNGILGRFVREHIPPDHPKYAETHPDTPPDETE